MSVISVWVGAATSNSVWVRAKVDALSARVAVADNAALTDPTFYGAQQPTAQGMVSMRVEGLAPATRYWYAVETDGVLDTTFPGQFRTLPIQGQPVDFRFGVSACAGLDPLVPGVGDVLDAPRISNHHTFDTVRQQALDEDWVFYCCQGDMLYYNPGGDNTNGSDAAAYRREWDDVLLQPNQHGLYRNVPLFYVWDDHDYGPNNADSLAPGRLAAQQVYREKVPHYSLPAARETDGNQPIYQTITVGRVLIIATDTRSSRTPDTTPDGPTKTLLGARQKAWMRDVLSSSDAKFLVWLTTTPWIQGIDAPDNWSGFATEANEITTMFTDTGWIDRMIAVTGDTHHMAIDSGASDVTYGHIPLFVFNPIDSTPNDGSGVGYDLGSVGDPGRGQYGVIDVKDSGNQIMVTGTGYIDGTVWKSFAVTTQVATTGGGGTPPPVVQGGIPDPAAPRAQNVTYTYWPVTFADGNFQRQSASPLPLSGVQFSTTMRGTGELKGSLQLADDAVRSVNPWSLVVARKTGIVVVRTVTDPDTRITFSTIPWAGIVWAAPTDPSTGRMSITAQSVESLWARRQITGAIVNGVAQPVIWSQVDQQQIAADLLDPRKFSQIPLGDSPNVGWIWVDPPTQPTGRLRDMTYDVGQGTNLLTAHKDRSNVIDGYEWYTTMRVLSGDDALSADAWRPQFVLGYPRLGRQFAKGDLVPTFQYRVNGQGNVVSYEHPYDGSTVNNIEWGVGQQFGDDTLQVLATNSASWNNGFLQTEGKYTNPDVSITNTLQEYTNSALLESLANEQYITNLKIRGDLPPYFGSYEIGDDIIFETDDVTLPDTDADSGLWVYTTRVLGWTVIPPEGDTAETVNLVVAGGDIDL